MKFRIEINQKEIIESGIKGVKIQEWLLFDVVRHMIGADWTKKLTVGEKSYAWISEQSILDQIPLLELSKRQVHRWVDTLVDAGLLIRYENNIGEKRVYLGLTPVGDAIGRHSLTEMTSSKDSACQKRQAQPDRNDKLSLTEMSGDKYIKEKAIKDNTEPPTPLDGGSVEPPADSGLTFKKAPKVKKRISFEESSQFYRDQLKDLPPLPQNSVAAAAEQAQRDGYAKMVRWMSEGDVETPETMQSTVMAMGSQLTYDQLGKLRGDRKLTWYQIKHYLRRMHTYIDNKNLSIYMTIVKWHGDDIKMNKVPPASAPKTLETNQAIGVRRPSATNNDYSAK